MAKFNNPSHVAISCDAMLRVLMVVECLDSTREYWIKTLNDVKVGNLDWAPNPHGYILKWLSPYGRRAPASGMTKDETALELFFQAVQNNQTKSLDKWARQVNPLLIEKGLYRSMARSDSAYGSKEARLVGDVVTKAEIADKTEIAATLQWSETASQFSRKRALAAILAECQETETVAEVIASETVAEVIATETVATTKRRSVKAK